MELTHIHSTMLEARYLNERTIPKSYIFTQISADEAAKKIILNKTDDLFFSELYLLPLPHGHDRVPGDVQHTELFKYKAQKKRSLFKRNKGLFGEVRTPNKDRKIRWYQRKFEYITKEEVRNQFIENLKNDG